MDKELDLRVNMAGLFLERDSSQTMLSVREQERPDCICVQENRPKMWSQISDHTAAYTCTHAHPCWIRDDHEVSGRKWYTVLPVPESGASAGDTNGVRSQVFEWMRAGGWLGREEVNAETGAWSNDKLKARVSLKLVLSSAWTFRILLRPKDTLRLQPMFHINQMLWFTADLRPGENKRSYVTIFM